MKKTIFIGLLAMSLFGISACKEKHIPYILPSHALSLIHGDSAKTWKIARRYNDDVRMNMGPCFMRYRQTFNKNKSFVDNNEMNPDCGPSLKGDWQLINNSKGDHFIKLSSPEIPNVLHTEKDYIYFKILKVGRDTLEISFRHKQYGNKFRTIRDVLVRDNLDIGDRYFHH